MDEFMTQLTEYMKAMEGLVTQYAPDAINLGLNVARIHALQVVLLGVGSLALVVWGARLFEKTLKGVTRVEDMKSSELSRLVGAVFLLAAPTISGFLMNVWNLWAWVGIIYPEIYLAHGIVDKYLGA